MVATWSLDLLRALKPDSIPDAATAFISTCTSWDFSLPYLFWLESCVGIAPAWHASKLRLNESLKESVGAGLGGTSGGNLRNVLVMAEIALSLVLLVGAGLLIRSFIRLLNTRPGYDASNLLTFQISLPDSRYPKESHLIAFYREALDRIRACPGVESVAISNTLPPFGTETDGPFYVEGHEPSNPNEAPDTIYDPVSPEYFRTLKTPLIACWYFTEQENNDKFRVAVINQSMARAFFGGERWAVGKRMKLVGFDKNWWEVVGVVVDERFFGWDSDPVFRGLTFPTAQARSAAWRSSCAPKLIPCP